MQLVCKFVYIIVLGSALWSLTACQECRNSSECPTAQVCEDGYCQSMDHGDDDDDNDIAPDTDTDDTDTGSDADADSDADTDDGSIITWIAISGGNYEMGDDSFSSATPIHEVAIADFKMTKSEITARQYEDCHTAGVCTEPKYPLHDPAFDPNKINWKKTGRARHPINGVVWQQAADFCEWVGGRLPSEAEWEFAARSGGADNTYPWGEEEPSCELAIIGNGCGEGITLPVCSKSRGNTAHGVCDLAGGVFEWIADYWYRDYDGAPTDGSARLDPPFDGATGRVLRGGGFHDAAEANHLKTTYRLQFPQNGLDGDGAGEADLGFRCVKTP